MNRKKWQGLSCFLLASLMVGSTFAAPMRNEAPKSTTVPKATVAPQATQAPKTTTTPQATQTPKTTTMPQATQAPKTTATPQAPKAITTPQAGTTKKTENPCKKTCPNKPFTLDHFKMIVNTLKRMGLEEKEIVTYIKEGKKLEEILKAEKISPKKFKKCIIKEYCKEVDVAQKNGQITAEQAKQLKCAIKETIKNWLPKK